MPDVVAEQESGKRVTALVKTALSNYGKAHTSVQDAGLAVIEHAMNYGDCSRAKTLCRGVPSRERNSLVGWFALFSPIGVKMGKNAAEDAARFIKPESNLYHNFDLDGARANFWYDDPSGSNKEPVPLNTIMDFYQVIDRMLKKAIKDAGEGEKYKPEQTLAVKAQAEDLLTMVDKYRAKHIAQPFTGADDLPDIGVKADLVH